MKLIINADDFGLTKGVNKGIIECYKAGGLKSTTLMPMAKERNEAIQLVKDNPGLGVGVHLTLTTGFPILGLHNSLTKPDGSFKFRPDTLESLIDTIDLEELYNEWDAQINSLVSEIPITHFDSHHHVHMHPRFLPIIKRLQDKYQIPCRHNGGDVYGARVNGEFYKDNVSLEFFDVLSIKDNEDVIDVMSHPAYLDEHLLEISSYTNDRVKELEILTSPDFQKKLVANNIILINYREIDKK